MKWRRLSSPLQWRCDHCAWKPERCTPYSVRLKPIPGEWKSSPMVEQPSPGRRECNRMAGSVMLRYDSPVFPKEDTVIPLTDLPESGTSLCEQRLTNL